MTLISLADYEDGNAFKGDYDAEIHELEQRLRRIQAAHIMHKKSAIIAIEGWDASGKGGAIQRLTACWDPRYYEVWPISAPDTTEADHHFLWRFWRRLPARGEIAVFDRTWYGRVLVERIEGFATHGEWVRGYDEINAFEAQQVDNGVTLIKIFMHITAQKQDERFADRLDNPWKRWKTGPDDYRNRARRVDYLKAYAAMFERTDTRWAPWTVIDANHKKTARLAVLRLVADRLESGVSMVPLAADPTVVTLAEASLDDGKYSFFNAAEHADKNGTVK